jgi:predicted HicB family RNase H-like nuclease
MRTSIHIRLPASLIRALRERAEREQVSLNTLVVSLLAGAIGYPVEDGDK